MYQLDILEALNLDKIDQVHGAITNLRSGGHTIESNHRGWYVYKGSTGKQNGPVSVKQKAEVVALLEDDRLLVSVEGKLYVATEINV